jgi:adenylosuccinate lyase
MTTNHSSLHAVSPVDGRYFEKTEELRPYFSEYALIRYRVKVEIEYLRALYEAGIPELGMLSKSDMQSLLYIFTTFNERDGQKIKETEKVTNHDVKAVEYFIKEKVENLGLSAISEFVHFGLTSQDINNTAFPLMLRDAMTDLVHPLLEELIGDLRRKAGQWRTVPMLARTHGQAASPTTLGKEVFVFVERLMDQLVLLKAVPVKAKFGGASGNFNAHKVAYPDIDWPGFGDRFVREYLGLIRSGTTTQIAHYDDMAAIFQGWMRIGTILIDLCRDVWTYISMDYFKQKTKESEVGSSAMPHKVNPIDFENAEGNLGVANALFNHMAEKLPISRLQRDLTDSTVLRNIGVPFSHLLIALKSIRKGLDKLVLNEPKLHADLEDNWAVVAEAIQTVLRRSGYPAPYEALKKLTRGKGRIDKNAIHGFLEELEIDEKTREYLKSITPHNYVGFFYVDKWAEQ